MSVASGKSGVVKATTERRSKSMLDNPESSVQKFGVSSATATIASSKRKKSVKLDNHNEINTEDDASMASYTDPAVKQAREDLMSLGIELDDELIARLQNNLGIEKIFKVAHHAANTVFKSLPDGAMDGLHQEISYRNVNYSTPSSSSTGGIVNPHLHSHSRNGNLATATSIPAPLQPFLTDMVTIDPRQSIAILKQLENREDQVEPQYRPQLDALIDNFRIQYARAPLRFIGRLLGRKWNFAPPANNTTAANSNHANKKNQSPSGGNRYATANPSLGGHGTSDPSAVLATPTPATAGGAAPGTVSIQEQQQKFYEQELITRWILKHRYVTLAEFITMIQRIYPVSGTGGTGGNNNNNHKVKGGQGNSEVIPILFALLSEEKSFGYQHLRRTTQQGINNNPPTILNKNNNNSSNNATNPASNNKLKVVDLWNFLTLLKIASEASRRSFDNKTSKLANDVEFWQRDNNQHNNTLYNKGRQGQGQRNNSSSSNIISHDRSVGDGEGGASLQQLQQQQLKQMRVQEGWRIFENTAAENIRHPHPALPPPPDTASYGTATSNVASLLGQPHHTHRANARLGGRQVMGTIQQETINVCDIPSALHSPQRLDKMKWNRSQSNQGGSHSGAGSLQHQSIAKEMRLPIPPPEHALDSRNVAYLLHHQQHQQPYPLQHHSRSDPAVIKKRSAAHTLDREAFYQGKDLSVAHLLVDHYKPPNSSDQVLSNQQLSRAKSAPRGRCMSSPQDLYWDRPGQGGSGSSGAAGGGGGTGKGGFIKPSVAAALGGGDR